MEFLKSLVPAVISGDGGSSSAASDRSSSSSLTPSSSMEVLPRDTGPRLLRVKRLGLMAMGQAIEEDSAADGPSQPVRPPRLYRYRPKGNTATVTQHIGSRPARRFRHQPKGYSFTVWVSVLRCRQHRYWPKR